MKEIGILVIGHAGIGHDMLDLLFYRLEHTYDFDIIVLGGTLPKNNKSSNQPFEEFVFKNYYENMDFELKLAEIILTTDTEKSLASHLPCYEKIKLDRDYQFLSSHKELLRFNSRGVRPP